MLESRSAETSEPNRFKYLLAEYNPDDAAGRFPIGVVVQGAGKLLFRFLLPSEAGDLVPQPSKEVVFAIERSFNKDRDDGTIQILDRETGSRKNVPVTSDEYLEYLHSTFLNTITFTEPREIVANDAQSLLNSIFRSNVFEPVRQAVEAEALVAESLTDGLILLLHSRNDEPVMGSMKLQKMTFLLKKETKLGRRLTERMDEFEYTPHHFGPYSSDLESMVEVLKREGLVEIEEKTLSDANAELDRQHIQKSETELGPVKKKTMRVFKLTEDGVKLAEELERSLSSTELEELAKLKAKFNPYVTQVIIDYVYKHYENMTTKSKLRRRVQGRGGN